MEAATNKEGSAPGGPIPVSVSDGVMSQQAPTGNDPKGACQGYMALDRKLQDGQTLTNAELGKLNATLSPARMSRYLKISDGDSRLALRLHHWNAAVAGSLMPTLHVSEVAIRNFAMRRLIAHFGKHWYRDTRFEQKLGRSTLKDSLQSTVQGLLDAGKVGNLTDDVTSELTFGFWVNVFTKTFVPMLWVRPLHTINASIPRDVSIIDLHEGVEFVRGFRNNVAHHKNLVCKPTPENYERTLKVLGWVCQASAKAAREASQFPALWQCSPVPHDRLRT